MKLHSSIFSFRKMSHFLKKVFLFLLSLLFVYPLFIVFCESVIPKLFRPNINYQLGAYGHMHTRIEEVNRLKGELDILFLGSSHAYRGFDTRNFSSLKTFNFGSSSQTPIQTQTLLRRYIDKLKPKTVIYEVYPGTFLADGAESSLDIIANDKNDIHSLRMAITVNNLKVYNTLLYGFFSDFFGINGSFTESCRKGEDQYISGGFVEREMQYYKYKQVNNAIEAQFNTGQLRAFKENLAIIKRVKARLILVYAPITKALYNSYSNNHYVDSIMTSYGVEYYNFNTILSLNDSLDFYDAHHLNQNGVQKFNDCLLESVINKNQK